MRRVELAKSPAKGDGQLPEFGEDDNDRFSVINQNSISYPFAAATDADTPSNSSPWGDSSNEMMEPMINNNAESHNGLSPDGITLQQNVNFAEGSRGVLDVAFNSCVEVSDDANFGNNIILNEQETVQLNGCGLVVEPSTSGQNGMLSVQDLANIDAYAASTDQSKIQNAQRTQQPSLEREAPQSAQSVSQQRMLNTRKDKQPQCNCQRSRCIKLYCYCFSDDTYCGNSCSCSDCHNNKDYEDTVEHEREKKRLQNPNAFHSKLEMKDGTTPIRHKKGCNCRKSKCVKNYCECYQANIGCFGGCRCEDCKNPYNRKSDPSKMPNSNNNNPSAFGIVSQQNVP